MKNTLSVIFIFILATGVILAGTITVNSPTASTTWYKGNSYNITWTSSGCTNQNIKINIFKNSITQANFVEQLTCSDTGSKSWSIPGSYQNGNYILRIKTDDNLCVGDSPVFMITDMPQAPTITVTSPGSGSVWVKGNSYPISWNKTGTQSAQVKINLFRDSIDQSNFVEQLTGPNNGLMNWMIPGSYQSGNYILRVKPDDDSCSGDSPVFVVTDPQVQPVLKISFTNPHSGTVWRKGITYDITWTKSGSQSPGVKIGIYMDSISPANLKGQLTASNGGSKSWAIPADYATGTYYLKITTDDNLVTADSEPFQIKPKFQISPEMDVFPIHGKIEIIKRNTKCIPITFSLIIFGVRPSGRLYDVKYQKT